MYLESDDGYNFPLIECPEPESISGGVIRYTSLTTGSVVIYTCLQNYKLRGIRKRKCSKYGEWVGRSPFCLKYGNI